VLLTSAIYQVRSSGNAKAVTKYNIAAAVALHPVASLALVQPQVPIFYGTGSLDVVVPPIGPIGMYYKTTHAGKVLAEIKGATHFEPNTIGPNRWTNYAAAYFGCYLYKIDNACDTIYGSDSAKCDLCSCAAVPMTTCKHTSPSIDASSTQHPALNNGTDLGQISLSAGQAADRFALLDEQRAAGDVSEDIYIAEKDALHRLLNLTFT